MPAPLPRTFGGVLLSAFITLEVCRVQLGATGQEFQGTGEYVTLRISSIVGFSKPSPISGIHCVKVLVGSRTLYVRGDNLEDKLEPVTRSGR